jgi:hypothetical protein
MDLLSFITECRGTSCLWVEISILLALSTRTLLRWRHANNFKEPLRSVTTRDDLDRARDIVEIYKLERKSRGEVLLMGHLRGPPNNIWMRMKDLRKIINSVKSIFTSLFNFFKHPCMYISIYIYKYIFKYTYIYIYIYI